MNADLLRILVSETYENVSASVSEALADAVQFVAQTAHNLYTTYGGCSSPIQLEFSELQTVLMSVFLVIIAVNGLLIAYYWSKYGGVITDRFIRPSTLKEIEELKLSVAKLKLPFEHTPRI